MEPLFRLIRSNLQKQNLPRAAAAGLSGVVREPVLLCSFAVIFGFVYLDDVMPWLPLNSSGHRTLDSSLETFPDASVYSDMAYPIYIAKRVSSLD